MAAGVEPADAESDPDPWRPFVDALVRACVDAFAAEKVPATAAEVISQLDLEGGAAWDVALPLHRFAKTCGRKPEELAQALCQRVGEFRWLAGASAVGAYLNFRAEPDWLIGRTLGMVLSRGARYAHTEVSGGAVCVEHTSSNPTGPFHIGRVRNAIIGDTLARVLRAAGSPVTTHYYIDDVGRQAAMITWIWSMPQSGWPEEIRDGVSKAPPRPDAELRPHVRLGRPYPFVSAYLKTHPDAAEAVAELSRRLEAGSAPPEHHALAQQILTGMLGSLERIRIAFDELVWESSFLTDGSVERVIQRLRTAPHAVREENGAWALDTSGYGLPKESSRVIVTRADGTSLYQTRDVAYHLSKFASFPRVIDVLGQDHRLHARTLEAMLAEIGEPRRPEFVIYQYITVPEGGGMSTRRGSAIYLDDLLDEAVERAKKEVLSRHTELVETEVAAIAESVAAGAVRYHIVRVAPDKSVTFRWEDALSFEGRSGPFLQYAYARASSLLRKAGEDSSLQRLGVVKLSHPDELALVQVISRLPRTIAYVARTAHVHTLAGYAHDLAEAFHRFYQSVPVLTAVEERASRLALVTAFRESLGVCLDLLGMDRLERM
ncbi:MAG: arginine--tRNA ligase [Thermoplasmata archaeon]|nr:arginine--tRNA ligase [Thermoplasmata archaeon]